MIRNENNTINNKNRNNTIDNKNKKDRILAGKWGLKKPKSSGYCEERTHDLRIMRPTCYRLRQTPIHLYSTVLLPYHIRLFFQSRIPSQTIFFNVFPSSNNMIPPKSHRIIQHYFPRGVNENCGLRKTEIKWVL